MLKQRRGVARGAAFVGIMAILFTLGTAAPASADGIRAAGTEACVDAGTHYTTTNKQNLFIGLGLKYKSGPGGTVHASAQGSLTASAAVSISGGASLSAVVTSFNGTFGVTGTVSATISSTYSYDHVVAAGKYGTLQFGNWGWTSSLKKYVVDSACNITSTVYGTVTKMPSIDTWGYKYTETSS